MQGVLLGCAVNPALLGSLEALGKERQVCCEERGGERRRPASGIARDHVVRMAIVGPSDAAAATPGLLRDAHYSLLARPAPDDDEPLVQLHEEHGRVCVRLLEAAHPSETRANRALTHELRRVEPGELAGGAQALEDQHRSALHVVVRALGDQLQEAVHERGARADGVHGKCAGVR